MKKVALVSGIGGMDGSHLTDLLLEKGYQVHGTVRRSSYANLGRLDHVRHRVRLHNADLTDPYSLDAVVAEVKPTHVYNLAAQSQVRISFDIPEYTMQVTGLGALRLLESCRRHVPEVRFYQASTSEMFGATPPPHHEYKPFHPRSPYGTAKVFAHHTAVNYREAYGMFVSCGILFNHESPRRSDEFVTRKITKAAARIYYGLQEELVLGNLDARRDWGHAEDYVRAMYLMLEQDQPSDYVVGTGETHSVEEFVDTAFKLIGRSWKDYVRIDADLRRPSEVNVLCADSMKAHNELGWWPKIGFSELVKSMMEADMTRAQEEAIGSPRRQASTSIKAS